MNLNGATNGPNAIVAPQYYPENQRSKLNRWEWYVLVYWNALLDQWSVQFVTQLQQLELEFRSGHSHWQRVQVDFLINKKDRRIWRWNLFLAKLGLKSACPWHAMPVWLQGTLALRPLDEALKVHGRPLMMYPASKAQYAFYL